MKEEINLIHLTLLRHGESTGNAQGVLQGQTDYELSELGRQQAQWLAARWVGEAVSFDQIISSPLSRARQTAEIISAALRTPIEYDPNWKERDFGSFSGQMLDEVLPDLSRNQSQNPSFPEGDHGESQWDFFWRAERAVTGVLQQTPGRYLVVAHGGILNQALHALLGLPPQSGQSEARFILSNTGFASLSYDPAEQIWRLFRFNDKQHLYGHPSLPTGKADVERTLGQQHNQHLSSLVKPTGLAANIRPARLIDVDEILEIFAEVDQLHASARPDIFMPAQSPGWSRSFFESQLTEPGVYLLVAENEQQVLGCLHAIIKESPKIEIWKPRCWLSISNITVRSGLRGRGIGKALMQAAHSLAIELGLQSIELTVWEFNMDARAFYEQLGFLTSRRVMWLEVQ